jgi:hypothetical protein
MLLIPSGGGSGYCQKVKTGALRANCAQQDFDRRVVDDISVGTGHQGGALPFLIPAPGQHHDPQIHAFAEHLADGQNSPAIFKHVGDYHIGLQASRQGDRIRYPARFTDYLEIRFTFQHRPQTPAKDGVLIGKNHAQTRAPEAKNSSMSFMDARHQGNPIIIPRWADV